MAKYKLLVLGWGMEGLAHDLTPSEVEKLRSHKETMGYEEFNQMYAELPDLLDDFDHSLPNWWMASRAYVNDALRFVLKDENDTVLWEKKWGELGNLYDLFEKYTLPENFEDYSEMLDAYPHNEHENILCIIEDVKGTLNNYNIESDEVPTPEDFGFNSICIESPIFDYEVVNKVFFKNQELEKDYDDEWVNGKSLDVYVFTLEDVENGVYDEDFDEEE